MNKLPVFINLHIPKTAGYTLRYHITKNLKEDEHLLLDYEFLGLNLFDPPLEYEIYKKAAFKLIKSLSKEKREKIKIIHGHSVPYGVHELFDREAKYFTFVRNPLKRTVSVYNHLSYLNMTEGGDAGKYSYYEKYLRINGKDPGFSKWLRRKYVCDIKFQHFSMVGYLKEFGYLTGKISRTSINEALRKFHFIGLTENFSSESLYFFKELGMHKFFVDQNISKLRYTKRLSNNLRHEILLRNIYDRIVHGISLELNNDFKLTNPEFMKAVSNKYMERKMLLPFTQVLFAPRQTILRLYRLLLSKDRLFSNY